MNFTTRLLMPLAAISLIAAPALAQSFRIPTSGTPAVEIAKQTGWTERYDEHGNLTLFADDMAGAILLRMITAAPGEPMPSNAEMAQVILTGAGAKPYHKSEKTTFAGVRKLDEDWCEIRRIYLKKAFRSKGNGKKLFRAALGFAEKNCSAVVLKTDSTLTKAIDMYLKHGFTFQKEETGYLYFEKKFDQKPKIV